MTKAKLYSLTKRQIEDLCIKAILETKDGTWKRTWVDKQLKQLQERML